jgi:hypothetical protein
MNSKISDPIAHLYTESVLLNEETSEVSLLEEPLFSGKKSYIWFGLVTWDAHKVHGVVEIITAQYAEEESEIYFYYGVANENGDEKVGPIFLQIPKTYYRYMDNGEEKAARVELEAYLESPKFSKYLFSQLVGLGYPFIKDFTQAKLLLSDFTPYKDIGMSDMMGEKTDGNSAPKNYSTDIKPVPAKNGYGRTGTLHPIDDILIDGILGFAPNNPSPDEKVKYYWTFEYKGQYCAIWDYKGSSEVEQYSTFGPKEIFEELFDKFYHDTTYLKHG